MKIKIHSFIGLLIGTFIINMLTTGCSSPNIHEVLASGDRKALVEAINAGSDVNELNKEGMTPLHITVKNGDTSSTRLLLEHGANIEAVDKDGQTVVQTAFNQVFGSNLISLMEAGKKQSPDEPSVQNLVRIMNEVRRKSANQVELNGILSISIELKGISVDEGMQALAQVNFTTAEQSYVLNLSGFETKYINVDKSGSGTKWIVLLRPGSEYHVSGIEKNGELNATLLEFVEPPKNDDKMSVPLKNWLPDTWDMFFELPWVKELNINRN